MRCSLRMPLFCCKSFSFLLLSVKEHSLICVLPSSYILKLFILMPVRIPGKTSVLSWLWNWIGNLPWVKREWKGRATPLFYRRRVYEVWRRNPGDIYCSAVHILYFVSERLIRLSKSSCAFKCSWTWSSKIRPIN